MLHYFSREEAEALLPAVTVVLFKMQQCRAATAQTEEELDFLHMQARGNGHQLHKRMAELQEKQAQEAQILHQLLTEFSTFGCELKDLDTGLIDFLSQRDGREIYLCWRLGEERILYWHYLHTGFSGRQPL